MWRYNNLDELAHHGVLGMRWGVRRYQNSDGSLTPAGRRRANKLKDRYTKLTGKKLIRKPTSKNTKNNEIDNVVKKKSIREMSDEELRSKINRYQMEKQALQLESDLAPKGKKFVAKVRKEVIVPSAIDAGRRVLTDWLTKYGRDKTGLNSQAKDAYKALRDEVTGLELERRKLKAERDIAGMKNNKKKDKK